jgi:hypothetical protein
MSNTEIWLKQQSTVKYDCLYFIWCYCVIYSVTCFSFLMCLCSMVMASMQAETYSSISDVILYNFIFTFSAPCIVIHTHTHTWERPTEWITSKKFHCLEESLLASTKDAAVWNCFLFLTCQSFSILFPWIVGPSHHGTALPIWRVAANILNKQSRTADKRWPSSLGVGRCANNSSPQNLALLRNASGLYWSFGTI